MSFRRVRAVLWTLNRENRRILHLTFWRPRYLTGVDQVRPVSRSISAGLPCAMTLALLHNISLLSVYGAVVVIEL
jgi:hypothetical protein